MMKIRQASVGKAEEILILQKLAFQSQARLYDDYGLPPLTETLEDIRNEFGRQIFLIAEVDGRIVGSVRGAAKDGTCHVGRLVVHPDFQNQGIATKLMEELEAEFSSVDRFELFTGHKSKKSLYLYQKLGYRIIKSEKVREDLKLVYMEKISG